MALSAAAARSGSDLRQSFMTRLLLLIVVAAVSCQPRALRAEQTEFAVEVEMRDGVKLKTTVWRPGEQSYPVVLTRGYSPRGLGSSAGRWNESGYVFVSQQTRGNGGEDGSRFLQDDQDGYDCIQWIAQQPWCDGQVAMWGGSYWGITQWHAALAQPPALKAIIPGYNSAAYCGWENGYWRGGVLHLKMTSQGRVFPSGARYSLQEWKKNLMFLPLIDLDRKFASRENPLWNDYIVHSSNDDYWKAMSMVENERYEKIRIPIYIMVGWRDYYTDSSFAAFDALKRLDRSPDIRIRVDDRGHSGTPDFTESVRFLDYHLKKRQNGVADEPPIKLKVRNGAWEAFRDWPPTNATFMNYYLSSPEGDRFGSLLEELPDQESPTSYRYDPRDPVLTLGANGSHTYPEVPGLITDDRVDQRNNEGRPDVLVFASDRLTVDTKVVGPIEARIYAATSALDTDFVVRLLDEDAEGEAVNITEGVVRARFRHGRDAKPSLVTPDKIYEYKVELLPTAMVFKQGHRIRIHLTSSCFPLWDRNLNTGDPIGMSTETKVATQTIYHSREYPSRIILPIVTAEPNQASR